MHRRKKVRESLTRYAHTKYMNRSHYLKWVINEEWSIRYFFNFDKNPNMNRKYVLKSHFTKDYIVLKKVEAIDYIQYLCEDIRPKEYFSLNEVGVGYRRLVMDPENGHDCYIERYLKRKK